MTPERGLGRAAWAAGAALLFAAALGGAVGFALGRRPMASRFKVPDADMSLIGSRGQLLDSLGLSPARRATIDSILDDAQQRADSVVSLMVGDVRTVASETRARVRALLEPSQQARFDSLLTTETELRPRSPLPPRQP